MRDATLCFLIKKDSSEICLGMKKRGFAEGKYNGIGGKVDAGETIEQAMIRETQEEINVTPQTYDKVAVLEFSFPEDMSINQRVHVYICTDWVGDPSETEEIRPAWFFYDELPYSTMWPDDEYWLPLVLNDKKIQGAFELSLDDKILFHEIEEIKS